MKSPCVTSLLAKWFSHHSCNIVDFPTNPLLWVDYWFRVTSVPRVTSLLDKYSNLHTSSIIEIITKCLLTSCPINGWNSSTMKGSWQHPSTRSVEHFATKMVSSGYWYGIDTWQTLSTIMTLLTYTYRLCSFAVEKNISQLQTIICNCFCSFQLCL
jgi:hypothetical protein